MRGLEKQKKKLKRRKKKVDRNYSMEVNTKNGAEEREENE